MLDIIAELGSTHDGSLGNALAMVHAAAGAGAIAVKLQDHRGQVSTQHPPWAHDVAALEGRQEYLDRTAFSGSEWDRIAWAAEEARLRLVVSPFTPHAVNAQEGGGCGPAWYKVASGRVTDMPLLDAIGATGKPVLVSSGMSDWDEWQAAIDRVLAAGASAVVPMHCVSQYPLLPRDSSLRVVTEMQTRLRVPLGTRWGYSDHCLSDAVSLGAIALGATVIERHVTWSRSAYGTDARHSQTFEEFGAFCIAAHELSEALASGAPGFSSKDIPGEEYAMRATFMDPYEALEAARRRGGTT